jgi:hypothetical protein
MGYQQTNHFHKSSVSSPFMPFLQAARVNLGHKSTAHTVDRDSLARHCARRGTVKDREQ